MIKIIMVACIIIASCIALFVLMPEPMHTEIEPVYVVDNTTIIDALLVEYQIQSDICNNTDDEYNRLREEPGWYTFDSEIEHAPLHIFNEQRPDPIFTKGYILLY